MIIIKSSNNPIVDVLRPAQKLQVWNTYIPENMEICYFLNFKTKSNLRKCTDSPEPSLITEMRNNMEIRYFSIFEAQSSLRKE